MSITGQVGHVSFAKQTAAGTPNTTGANYKSVKITGDSLVASNNMIVAEGEIGTGRDVTQAIPGGFSSAGAVNGNLRVRAASIFLQAVLGTRTEVAAVTGPPATTTRDEFTPSDDLQSYTIEKKIGTAASSANELLLIQYTDAMVNTLNLSCPSGGLSTFSAGIIAMGENRMTPSGSGASATGNVVVDASGIPTNYTAATDDLLAFHGGRIRHDDYNASATDAATLLTSADDNNTFQSLEVVINNNIAADEWTIRPSRYLRSLTEGIRSIECNLTIVFENYATYQRYTYGSSSNAAPGYSLYLGSLEFLLANWQAASADAAQDLITLATPTGAGASPQAVQVNLPKLAFSGLPVALSTGRIAVSTTARALKPTGVTSNIIKAIARPQQAGLDYA